MTATGHEDRLTFPISPNDNGEHEAWLALSGRRLEEVYGADEEGYPLDSVKEANPEYEGR